uniref:E2 structural protein n=1 Tax=Transmissible gastroenteritis virus TaxID=11149 RepID=Q66201_TGEV|nr:unnamed protein product [Transmissible gastroenteritis virus]
DNLKITNQLKKCTS